MRGSVKRVTVDDAATTVKLFDGCTEHALVVVSLCGLSVVSASKLGTAENQYPMLSTSCLVQPLSEPVLPGHAPSNVQAHSRQPPLTIECDGCTVQGVLRDGPFLCTPVLVSNNPASQKQCALCPPTPCRAHPFRPRGPLSP